MKPSLPDQLVAEVIRLFPSYLEDPIDRAMCEGHGAVIAIGPDGEVRGHLFGADRSRMRRYLGIAARKAAQVFCTGYATERFETLVYAGKLDEKEFGFERPDLIGWKGGVPLQTPEGKLMAAAFSGIRGVKDQEIVERAAAGVPGLTIRRD